jgi:hypothetical protein
VRVVFDHRKYFFFSVNVLILPYSGCSFFSSWDEGLSTLWISLAFSVSSNIAHIHLIQPVAEAATSQVKLCPYNEEKPHIWFRLIEAQFTAAGIRTQKLTMPMP